MKDVMMNERSNTNTMNPVPHFRRCAAAVLAAISARKATVGALALLLGGSLTSLAAEQSADNRAPEVPFDISVGTTNKVHFHGYAEGGQIYTWNGTSWGNAVPRATLFDDDGNVVIAHFG